MNENKMDLLGQASNFQVANHTIINLPNKVRILMIKPLYDLINVTKPITRNMKSDDLLMDLGNWVLVKNTYSIWLISEFKDWDSTSEADYTKTLLSAVVKTGTRKTIVERTHGRRRKIAPFDGADQRLHEWVSSIVLVNLDMNETAHYNLMGDELA